MSVNIIEEAMEKEPAFECRTCPEPAESCLAHHPCEHSVRAAIEHAVRRCAEVAMEHHRKNVSMAGQKALGDYILRAAGLEE